MPDEQPSRRERRRLEIRHRIVETAFELFETQGYEATTVTEIAEQSDIAYGTLFQHFPSKLELLREVSVFACYRSSAEGRVVALEEIWKEDTESENAVHRASTG